MNALSRIIKPTTSPYPIQMLVLSHSSRGMFRSCARKLEFRQFYGTPPGRSDNYAGDVGNAIHRGMGEWLVTQDETKAVIAFMKAFPYHLEMLKAKQADRSLEAAYGTLMQLINSPQLHPYDIAQIKIANGETKFCVEVPFAIQVTNSPLPIPVWFVGFLDMILYDPITDRYIVHDLKTTRQNLDDKSARYQFDEQCVPYGIVLEHALGKKINEIDVSYLSAYTDLLEPKIELFPFRKTPEDVHDWHVGLCDDIERIAKYYKQGWFPRATDGQTCVSWNSKCQFFDVCSYRDHEVIKINIMGEVRQELFTTMDEDGKPLKPWITAQLPYIGGV